MITIETRQVMRNSWHNLYFGTTFAILGTNERDNSKVGHIFCYAVGFSQLLKVIHHTALSFVTNIPLPIQFATLFFGYLNTVAL